MKYKIGDILYNTKTNGFGKVQAIEHDVYGFVYLLSNLNTTEQKYGWFTQDCIDVYIDTGVLIKWLDPIKQIKKHKFILAN